MKKSQIELEFYLSKLIDLGTPLRHEDIQYLRKSWNTQQIIRPLKTLFHCSPKHNRASILSKGLLAFQGNHLGVFANEINQSENYFVDGNFYPSISDDTFLGDDRFDFWKIHSSELKYTWLKDESPFGNYVFTLNDIPPAFLSLYKCTLIENNNEIRKYDLSPNIEVNTGLTQQRKTHPSIYL